MNKIKINMHDQFSGATTTIERKVSDELLAKIEYAQINGIIQTEFSNNIRWEWIIDEVELLN